MLFASVLASAPALAGNEQKRGQAGATELLINPWARSAGWAGSATAAIRGVESMNHNIGGLAFVEGTEINFSSTRWLSGSDINIHSFGLGQSVGDNGGVLGLSVMSMDLGNFKQTDENNPDQDVNFEASFINIGLSYSKVFSNSIYGGITVRVISESIPNASAQGIAFDGGVQYVTTLGKGPLAEDNFKVGVSLRNVGPEMRFTGDGLAYTARIENGTFDGTIEQRSESFEIPSLLNIGVAYDLNLTEIHKVTIAGNFNANSFTNDQVQVGAEYSFDDKFMVRGGFDYQKNIFNKTERNFAHTGPTAGATVQLPFGPEKDKLFGLDYAFRSSNPWGGSHSVGVRMSF